MCLVGCVFRGCCFGLWVVEYAFRGCFWVALVLFGVDGVFIVMNVFINAFIICCFVCLLVGFVRVGWLVV